MEVIISDESAKKTADCGGKILPHEFCIPVKVFLGHVLNLLEKGVDQVLLPRMTNRGKNNYFCPKLIGLPEIVQYTTGLSPERMFSPEIICNGLQLKVTRFPKNEIFSVAKMKNAEQIANCDWEKILIQCRRERITLPEAISGIKRTRPVISLNIGVLGYAYCLYDPIISKKIINKLSDLGVAISTWEMIEPALIEQQLAGLKRPLFWNFGRMILGAGLHFLNGSEIDGIIYVSAFGCGPDSVATKILSLEAKRKNKPLLVISLDEHTEDGHLQTRLEAFTEMITEKREDYQII